MNTQFQLNFLTAFLYKYTQMTKKKVAKHNLLTFMKKMIPLKCNSFISKAFLTSATNNCRANNFNVRCRFIFLVDALVNLIVYVASSIAALLVAILAIFISVYVIRARKALKENLK